MVRWQETALLVELPVSRDLPPVTEGGRGRVRIRLLTVNYRRIYGGASGWWCDILVRLPSECSLPALLRLLTTVSVFKKDGALVMLSCYS